MSIVFHLFLGIAMPKARHEGGATCQIEEQPQNRINGKLMTR